MIDTGRDMVAAYIVATVIYLGYMASLWLRGRRLRARLASMRDGDETAVER
jgi:hypothetical protein